MTTDKPDKLSSIALLSKDNDLQQRVTAAAALQRIPDPSFWAMSHTWDYAARSTWGSKYQHAIDTFVQHPGRDDSVITDSDILSAVQEIRAKESKREGRFPAQ